MAFAAIGALAAAETVTATLVLGAVAEVGTAMAVVGAVTGNKDLARIGGTMALVGGVGGMVMGVGDTAAASAAAGSASEGVGATLKGFDAAAGDAFSGASAAGDAAMSNFSNSAAGAAMDADTAAGLNANLDVAPGTMDVGATPDAMGNTPTQSQGTMQVGTDNTAGAPQATPVADNTIVKDNTVVNTPADTYPEAQSIRNANNTDPSLINKNGAPQSTDSYFQAFSKFANDNRTLFDTGMRVVGGALNGANQRDIANQQNALMQQKLNQTSYGSNVANFAPTKGGIIQGVRTA